MINRRKFLAGAIAAAVAPTITYDGLRNSATGIFLPPAKMLYFSITNPSRIPLVVLGEGLDNIIIPAGESRVVAPGYVSNRILKVGALIQEAWIPVPNSTMSFDLATSND